MCSFAVFTRGAHKNTSCTTTVGKGASRISHGERAYGPSDEYLTAETFTRVDSISGIIIAFPRFRPLAHTRKQHSEICHVRCVCARLVQQRDEYRVIYTITENTRYSLLNRIYNRFKLHLLNARKYTMFSIVIK